MQKLKIRFPRLPDLPGYPFKNINSFSFKVFILPV
ncbi:hypothetical protein NIASO_05345 [Niabella soli DSM 19437]|uniref:Uncharacterized protein n=1 Tax=Niabella soli DSM 19437 TaxID=929713 RepID=W0F672_9BACT|nr:hypothetical protein NIASO_05345 [Niabella soli DSM 19437]